ncbi:MAG: dephospho-CoA kinase [Alphaproteobacteria bacterium]|nr:dephospho-CoA kinase [Alphaproteobacteria bacterium]
MRIIGLTGSIGMGKTETARMFARAGVPVFDSDAAVHALYAPGGAAVGPILAAFPGTGSPGTGIDRSLLSKAVMSEPDAFRRLEAIIHPLVAAAQRDWLAARRAEGAEFALLDIPLLFETGGHTRCDAVVVVSAPPDVQRARVLARPGMTPEKLDSILSKQLADHEKRARADFIIETDKGLAAAEADVHAVLARLRAADRGR